MEIFLENSDIIWYITGANAYMLSGDLSTLLTGRYVGISMLPLSFWEYVELVSMPADQAFADYLKHGGMPYVAVMDRTDEMEVLEEAFVFYSSERFDIVEKRLLKSDKKWRMVYLGLRNHILPRKRAYQPSNLWPAEACFTKLFVFLPASAKTQRAFSLPRASDQDGWGRDEIVRLYYLAGRWSCLGEKPFIQFG